MKNPAVAEAFAAFPEAMRRRLLFLRALILETADEIPAPDSLEETLKWGEPSYRMKGGSTIRIAWKASRPEVCMMYFRRQSRLVETFRVVYPDVFDYEGNRAIVFDGDAEVAVTALKHCIATALTYHANKPLSLLGMADGEER